MATEAAVVYRQGLAFVPFDCTALHHTMFVSAALLVLWQALLSHDKLLLTFGVPEAGLVRDSVGTGLVARLFGV
jgi:hypothetical protein